MEYITVIGLLCMVITGTVSWCPPHTSITTSPIRGLSRPRAFHQSCCQGRGSSCGCGSGMQCCPNRDIRFICVVDPCDPNPCGNGICATDHAGKRQCFCSVGTIKDRSGLCITNPCSRNPCGRGGRCTATGPQGRNTFTCRCSGDQVFNGKTCVANSCNRLRCGGSRCIISGGRAVCNCNSGSRFDGRSCVPADPCLTHSCGVGGHCTATNGRAECRCRGGFNLDSRTRACVLDNPCNRIFCGRGTCSRSGSTAVCNCETGFRFDTRTSTCVRLDDPCRGADCGTGGVCRVSRNQPTCECQTGFIFDSRIQGCTLNPCKRLRCRGRCVLRKMLGAIGAFCVKSRPVIATTTRRPPVTQRQVAVASSGAVSAVLGGRCTSSSCSCNAGFQFDRSTVTCQVSNACQGSRASDVSRSINRGVRSGCLKSRNFPGNYPNDLFDEVAIPTSGSSTLTIVIQDMQIQTRGSSTSGFVQNNCFNDFLFISGQLFCGSLGSNGAHRVLTIDVSGRAEIIVGMVSDGSFTSRGFLLKWELS